MLLIQKKGFKVINGKLEKQYNVRMKKTNKGYNIVGFDNDKIINKHVRYFNKTNNQPNTMKSNKKENKKIKKKTIKKNKKTKK